MSVCMRVGTIKVKKIRNVRVQIWAESKWVWLIERKESLHIDVIRCGSSKLGRWKLVHKYKTRAQWSPTPVCTNGAWLNLKY